MRYLIPISWKNKGSSVSINSTTQAENSKEEDTSSSMNREHNSLAKKGEHTSSQVNDITANISVGSRILNGIILAIKKRTKK